MNTPAPTLIHLDGVTKVFYTDDVETHALSGIHLDIDRGELRLDQRPVGLGKSTLLSILGLLDIAVEGKYILNGKRRSRPARVRRARAAIRNQEIGFIFQAFNLIGDLTVDENVELPLTYRGMPPAERKKRVAEALESVSTCRTARATCPPQLSGGQQQRVAVARAVVGDPLILLADEPTGNLDSKNGDAVMELLAGCITKGATICMVTHDPDYARNADRVVHLFDGRVVEDDAAARSEQEARAARLCRVASRTHGRARPHTDTDPASRIPTWSRGSRPWPSADRPCVRVELGR